MPRTATRRLKIPAVALAVALTLASCGGEPAAERLENMSDEEWNDMPEDEQTQLVRDAAEELGNDGMDELVAEKEDAGELQGDTEPLMAGEIYTYADGLEITLGDPYEYDGESSFGKDGLLAIDLTATNPTDGVIETTQAWVNLRAGDTGEKSDWYDGHLEATLQPGAEASEPYTYDLPMDTEHITATVQWLESNGEREDVVFTIVP